MNRIASGIEGFDKIVGGGLPEKDIILLSGECGTGKSVFGMQFIVSGKDHGIFVSFEDDIPKITETSSVFGWDLKALEQQNKIKLLRYDPFKLEDIIEIMESHIREINAKRVVIDSVSALGMYMKDASEIRRMLLQIESVLRRNGCTGILISELNPDRHSISRFGVEEYVTDGVIVMKRYLSDGEYHRGISVLKMRGSEHSSFIHKYSISKDGIGITEKLNTNKLMPQFKG